MKRLLKRFLRNLYQRTEFIRRPIRAELEANLKTCVAGSFEEVRMVMDDLVTEVYRLQHQVAELKDEIAELKASDTSSLVLG